MKKIGFIIAMSTLMVASLSAQSQSKTKTQKKPEGTITTPSKEQSKGDTKTSKTARSNKKKAMFQLVLGQPVAKLSLKNHKSSLKFQVQNNFVHFIKKALIQK